MHGAWKLWASDDVHMNVEAQECEAPPQFDSNDDAELDPEKGYIFPILQRRAQTAAITLGTRQMAGQRRPQL